MQELLLPVFQFLAGCMGGLRVPACQFQPQRLEWKVAESGCQALLLHISVFRSSYNWLIGGRLKIVVYCKA